MAAVSRTFSFFLWLSCCSLVLSLSIVETSFASNASTVSQRLAVINNMADKNQALNSVTLLRQNNLLSPVDKLLVLTAQGRLFHKLGKLDSAIESATAGQKLAKEHNFQKLEADASKMLGVYAYYKGDNNLALTAYQQSLSYYLSVNKPIAQANLYNNIALVYAAMGRLAKALATYKLAEPLYQEYGSDLDQVDLRFNIAGLHLRLKRFDTAIAMLHEVIDKRKEMSDEHGLAMAYTDLGSSYKYAGDYQQAYSYMIKALDYFQQENNGYNIATLFHNLAELHTYINDTEQAIVYAKKGIQLSMAQGNNYALAGSLYSLAMAYFLDGEYDLAITHLERSSELATKMHYNQQLDHNLALQALIFAAKNQNVKAIDRYRRFLDGFYQIANTELNSQLALFDAEQLQQQVAQLKQQKRLQELELDGAALERNIIIIVVVATLLIGFLIARRNTERRSNQELESKVKQRTNELEYLMQELQGANKIKSQFLANMSHEIRTPLTTVIGQAEAIISGDVDEEYIGKEVEIIHGNSLHLLELINNILDLSKIEANKIELDIHTQNLHDILQELANMFALQAKSKRLTFEIIHSLPSPFLIEIDGFRVKQILINLCSNAIKFTPKGHVELKIIQDEASLNFKITDSGIGMSSSQLQKLFESFTQGDSSISRRFGGSGLGLCLSDQLAKIMGGKIDVQSELNQGSVFAFSLPCKVGSTEQCAESRILADDDGQDKQAQLQGKILLADDHNDNRRLIARLLTTLGLEVISARNGHEAVALFEQHQPKLVLMDIQMPEMDGIEAFKVIRQTGSETPILALTANAMSHEIAQYLSLGFDGHLSKPIERNIFIPTIAKFYDGVISQAKAQESFNNVVMDDLVQEFKSNLVLEQQDLVLHINNNDLKKLTQLSHRIAGAGQMFGFPELSKLAIALEMAIKNNETASVRNRTQELLNEIDQVLW